MNSQSLKTFNGMICEGSDKAIPEANCVRQKNMICLENKFLTRSGYKKYNSVPYSGHINLIYEFHRIAGGTLNITGFGDSLFVGTPTFDSAPSADAGADQVDVVTGATVMLNGTASERVISYLWTQTSGTTVTLSDTTSATPTFTMPASDVIFQLQVTNSWGNDTDTVDVTNALVLPVADAGTDQSKDTGDTVTLDGSASTDVTSYLWTQTSGTTVTLSDATVVAPTFTMPSGDVAFSLKVTNFRGDDTDTVEIINTPDDTYVSITNSYPSPVIQGDSQTLSVKSYFRDVIENPFTLEDRAYIKKPSGASTLHFYIYSKECQFNDNPDLHIYANSNDAWTEETLLWDNKPSGDVFIETITNEVGWHTIDLTSHNYPTFVFIVSNGGNNNQNILLGIYSKEYSDTTKRPYWT